MKIPLLTEGESKVYTSLNELGESTTGLILKNSGVSHSKIYDILKRLSKKGLVSTVNKNGVQHFSPAPPERLNELVNETELSLANTKQEVKEIINKLKIVEKTGIKTSALNSYEGIKGMKTVLEKVLSHLAPEETVLILGSPKKVGEQTGGYLKNWQQKRINKKAKCKIIVNKDSISWDDKWWKESKRKKLTITKKSNNLAPAYLVITNSVVATIYFSEKPLSFLIEHKEIAKSYKEFFNQAWRESK
ncbi:hypothetical protein HN587_05175 [Candidatus Woesearchaeota archaeon]|jgi:sugar-specific transcriptional regulator TrmB|nr:hypothetical protein [Candidatus Woesearchaeota archaeon]